MPQLKFRADNADRDGDEVKAANDELNAFLPDAGVVYGPYNIDPASVTEAQLTLKKVPTGFNADKIDFDSVIVYYGDTAQDLPLYLSGDMDYSSNAYSPANLDAIRVPWVPTLSCLAVPPRTDLASTSTTMCTRSEKRKYARRLPTPLIAWKIVRLPSAKVAARSSIWLASLMLQYLPGFRLTRSPNSTPMITTLVKAEALLTGLGFTKGSDGIWVDDKGKKMEFELKVPADFTEYLASSENVAQQLAKFGIKINVKPYDSAQRNDMHKAGDYQMSMDIGMRFTYFHPFVSYDYNLRPGIGFKNDPEGAEGARGMDFPYRPKTADGKEINIKE